MTKDPFPTNGIPFFKGKRVAVTGASGLIGSYGVKLLKESGAYVRAICGPFRSSNAFTKLADEIVAHDLSNLRSAETAVDGMDAVFGGAGVTGGVNLPKLDPVSYVGPASAMVIHTLHACFSCKVPLFGYLSSTTVYAPSEKPVIEDDTMKSDAFYPLYRGIGVSKRFLEKLCLYYHETTGMGVSVIRPAGAYGRFDNFNENTSHVLPGMVQRALRTRDDSTFEVWGDGGDIRDFIHAQDVARCLLLSMANVPNADPLNCASGIGVTTTQLAQTVLDAMGSKAQIIYRTDKPSALRVRLVDVTKAENLAGFKAEISLSDGIRDVVSWRMAQ